jgi:hypothetical protein
MAPSGSHTIGPSCPIGPIKKKIPTDLESGHSNLLEKCQKCYFRNKF